MTDPSNAQEASQRMVEALEALGVAAAPQASRNAPGVTLNAAQVEALCEELKRLRATPQDPELENDPAAPKLPEPGSKLGNGAVVVGAFPDTSDPKRCYVVAKWGQEFVSWAMRIGDPKSTGSGAYYSYSNDRRGTSDSNATAKAKALANARKRAGAN